MQEHIFEHFNSEGHTGFLENVFVTFIDKTGSQNPEKRENYWIHTLKTMAPWGLNILNSAWTTRIRTLFSFSDILGQGRFKGKICGCNILLFRICVYVFIYICVCIYVYM